jgi:predicted amidohydrolase
MESYSSAFRKVGFFQFVRNYEHPVAELRSCLIATGGTEKLKQSVIVLPEAFNIGRDYDDQDHACDYGRSILSVLMDLSSTFQVTFIAGLVIENCVIDRLRRKRPYSSTYLIDPRRHLLMCQKLNDDRSNNYTACNEHDVIDRPVVLADTCLVALICRDCNPEKPHDIRRHQELKDSIVRGKKTHNIVCIPAHMSGGSGFGAEGIASS